MLSSIKTLFSQIGIKDLIDILLVATIFYQVFAIIRGTRAVQMLIGLIFLLALFGFGVHYKLYALNWILNHFFESIIIITAILFQDQIRAALAQFGGGGRMFGGFTKQAIDEEIDELIEAVRALSKSKTGALFVFERGNGLINYSSTGTVLKSKIHADLLYSLFQTRSPLHDGAIIIGKGLLQAAGCLLPLSKNVEIDKRLGTRHRAALGITEVSDAVAVVVSEETGGVSLAIKGEFYPCADEFELGHYLKSLWASNTIPVLKKEDKKEVQS